MPTKKSNNTRRLNYMRKKNIMLKLTDTLMQKQLITPAEKNSLTTMTAQQDKT